MFQKNDEFKTSMKDIRTTHNYAKKAYEGQPNDKKVKELYEKVKAKFEESTKTTEGEKKGLKKVIVTDPEEEKQKAEE